MSSRSASGHETVEKQAGMQLYPADTCPLVDRPRKRERLHEMRGNVEKSLALSNRFVDKVKLSVLEVANSTVYQPR
jgi:hypothetical protein